MIETTTVKILIIDGSTKDETLKNYLQKFYRLRYVDMILDYNKDMVDDGGIDKDEYDDHSFHLLAIDKATDNVLGGYRIMPSDRLEKAGLCHLCEKEFNFDAIKGSKIVELGRAVVDRECRDGSIINLLWKGLFRFTIEEKYDFIVGTASFHGVDPEEYKEGLSYLYYKERDDRAYANSPSCEMNFLTEEEVSDDFFRKLPPLIKGYLRLGAKVGHNCYIDYDFKSVDVFIIAELATADEKMIARFMR